MTAGVIPGVLIPELSRRWYYTSADSEADMKLLASQPGASIRFKELQKEAMDYANAILDPGRLNWVRVDWIWY